ncbi:hinge connector of long tail fiber proximal connector [Klebsiella phage CPRSA]|nr:hinge connector of long tail fiber proximal connector [Klebsiella phage CPRSA]
MSGWHNVKLNGGFGPDFVETQILSETNSVTYRITAKATHPNAVPNQYEFTLNQKAVGTPPSVGINVWRINNAVVDPIKTFTLSNDNSATANKAFVEYMDAQPSGLYLIMTNGEYKTSQIVDDWFAKKDPLCGKALISLRDSQILHMLHCMGIKISYTD